MIGDLFRSLQESETSRIGRLSERLAEASIDSQKQVDETDRPNLFTHMYYLSEEPRPYAYNVYSCMCSYFKGRDGGAASSFSTVQFYNEQAKNKRQELVEKYGS